MAFAAVIAYFSMEGVLHVILASVNVNCATGPSNSSFDNTTSVVNFVCLCLSCEEILPLLIHVNTV